MVWAKTTTRRGDKHLNFWNWCGLYYKFDGIWQVNQHPDWCWLRPFWSKRGNFDQLYSRPLWQFSGLAVRIAIENRLDPFVIHSQFYYAYWFPSGWAYWLTLLATGIWAPPQYKGRLFPGMRIFMLKIRRSWDRLIFNMGIPILVRHLYIETAPWALILYEDHFTSCGYCQDKTTVKLAHFYDGDLYIKVRWHPYIEAPPDLHWLTADCSFIS